MQVYKLYELLNPELASLAVKLLNLAIAFLD